MYDLARRDIKCFIEPAGRDIKYLRSRLVSLSSNLVGYNEFEAGLRMDPKVSSRDRKVLFISTGKFISWPGQKKYCLVRLSSNVAGYKEFEVGLRMGPKVSSSDRKILGRPCNSCLLGFPVIDISKLIN